MNDVALVQKVVGPQDLVRDGLDPVEAESVGAPLKLLKKCLLHVIENQVQLAFFAEVFPQIHNVIMALLFEDSDFAHHCLSHMRVLFLALLELLDGHDTPRFPLLRLEHLAVGALADHLQNPVLLHTAEIIFIAGRHLSDPLFITRDSAANGAKQALSQNCI